MQSVARGVTEKSLLHFTRILPACALLAGNEPHAQPMGLTLHNITLSTLTSQLIPFPAKKIVDNVTVLCWCKQGLQYAL
jgi:hypothetical protein